MEPEEVESRVDADKAEKPPIGCTEDAVENTVNENEEERQPTGKVDTADASSLHGNSEEKDQNPEKPEGVKEKPSKRLQEAQSYNNRNRKYNHTHDRKPYRGNNMSELVSQKESSDPDAIRKQVEFYFSDSNLLQDKFLFTKVEGHNNSPVPISMIHSFRRMRHFQPLSAIVNALKESTTINVVEDDTCIQRKEPLPEGLVGKPMNEIQKVHEDASMARSIYAKGFGNEEPSTQFDIEAFFANYGSTNSVRLRRTLDQTFKGSVFVEFDSEATQKSFLALDPTPKWHGKDLLIKSKKQYCDDKVDDIKAGKVRANEHSDRGRGGFKYSHKRRRDSPNYDKGRKSDDNDDRDWRERREEDRKSGFKDRRGGKHRGFGSGRGRGGRNDRDRRDRRANQDSKDDRGIPKVQTTTTDSGKEGDSPITTSPEIPKKDQGSRSITDDVVKSDLNGDKAADTSKKRTRDEDEVPEGEGPTKKVETEVEGA